MNKLDVYNAMPVWVQNIACNAVGLIIQKNRYGKVFDKYLCEYESHNTWSYEELCEYRDARLRKMVMHCYKTVPYYKKMFKSYGIDPKTIKRKDDLKVLPVLDKKTVRDNYRDFISEAAPEKAIKIHCTSGTTGAPLPFHTTWEEEENQWAIWWRYRRKLGIGLDTLCGHFGGKLLVPQSQRRSPYWRSNMPCHQVYFSAFHINEDTWRAYYNCLKKYNIRWIHGYPSVISALGKFMLEHDTRLELDVVTTGAENLLDNQRDIIVSAFLNGRDRLYQHYGLTEGVANISENRDHSYYIDEDFAIVEFEEKIPGGGKTVIGTALKCFVMPLLRYDTGDIVSFEQTDQNKYIGSFDGRQTDMILLKNGRLVSGAAFSIGIANISNIRECQIVYKNESIQINFVPEPSFSETDAERLVKEMRDRCGDEIDIVIKEVDSIPRDKSGKMKLVVYGDI